MEGFEAMFCASSPWWVSFWAGFWPNLAATLLGVIVGLPCALWINRKSESRRRERDAEQEREDLVVSLRAVLDAIDRNRGYLGVAAQLQVGHYLVQRDLDFSTWEVVGTRTVAMLRSAGNSRMIARHFERLKELDGLIVRLLDTYVGPSAALIQINIPREAIRVHINSLADLLFREIDEIDAAIRADYPDL